MDHSEHEISTVETVETVEIEDQISTMQMDHSQHSMTEHSLHLKNLSLDDIIADINLHNIDKEHTIRVLILQDDNKYSDNYTDNDDFTGGYHYDVFKMLLQDQDGGLYQDYKYEISYTNPNDTLNYDTFVDQVNNDEYDLVIGGFSINEERESKINFSIPLYINRVGILHLNKKTYFQYIKAVSFEIGKIAVVIILLGFIIAQIKFIFDPNRYNSDLIDSGRRSTKKTKKCGKSNESKEDRGKRYRKHVVTGVSSFLGEMGALSENATLTNGGLFLVICIMLFSFLFVIYAQARITTVSFLLETTDSKILFDQINSDYYRPFLAKEGNAEAAKIQLLRGRDDRVEIENMSFDNLVNKYAFENNKYAGVVMLYTDAYQYLRNRDKNFTFSMDGYGLEPSCWICSTRPHCIPILKDINLLILKHRSLGTNVMSDTIEFGHLTTICKDYIKEKNACLF